MNTGEVAVFLFVCSLALFFAEMQTRQTATTRWLLLAILWLIIVALLMWTAVG